MLKKKWCRFNLFSYCVPLQCQQRTETQAPCVVVTLIITQEQGPRAFPKGLLAFKNDPPVGDRRRLPLNLLFLGLVQYTQGNSTNDAQNMFNSNFLKNFVFVCSIDQLCLTLCGRMDCILTDSSVLGIFQARILE